MSSDRLRVIIADDEPLVRKALALTVASDPEMDLVGCAADAGEAIELAQRLHPDVALVDIRMPGGGPHAAAQIAEHSPDTRVVAFSALSEGPMVLAMVRAGVTGYVVKGSRPEDVLDAIRRVARGERVLPDEIAELDR